MTRPIILNFTIILNFKNDDGYDIIINFSNVLYCQKRFELGYRIVFNDKEELWLSYTEYDRLTKALEKHGA